MIELIACPAAAGRRRPGGVTVAAAHLQAVLQVPPPRYWAFIVPVSPSTTHRQRIVAEFSRGRPVTDDSRMLSGSGDPGRRPGAAPAAATVAALSTSPGPGRVPVPVTATAGD
jgi:hypothetical protein